MRISKVVVGRGKVEEYVRISFLKKVIAKLHIT